MKINDLLTITNEEMKKEYKTPDLILGYLNKKDLKILYINPPIKNDLQKKTTRLERTNSRN